jgi:hypothetical protein
MKFTKRDSREVEQIHKVGLINKIGFQGDRTAFSTALTDPSFSLRSLRRNIGKLQSHPAHHRTKAQKLFKSCSKTAFEVKVIGI